MTELQPHMAAMVLGAAIACVAVLVLVPVLRPLAVFVQLVDHPGGRKQHQGAVPLVGGLAVFLAYALSTVITVKFQLWDERIFWVWTALVVLGLVDDIRHVLVGIRVLIQVLLIIFLCSFTRTHIATLGDLLGNGPILLGSWGLPLTILGLIGVKNGINLLDGMDGLAGTQVLAALCWLMALSLHSGTPALAFVAAPLAGAVMGFLVYNLRLPGRRAWVFLGDHGSVFLGFALGWFAVAGSQGSKPSFTPIEAVWVLGLPVLETIRVMLSRMNRGRSPFQPGRDHLHHLLLGLGLSSTATVMAMLAMALLFGAVAWSGRWLGLSEVFLLCAFLGLSAVYFLCTQYLDQKLNRSGAGNQSPGA